MHKAILILTIIFVVHLTFAQTPNNRSIDLPCTAEDADYKGELKSMAGLDCQQTGNNTPTTIDILLLYTNQAMAELGGTPLSAQTEIENAIAEANLINSNSGINLTYNIAAIEQSDYQEVSSLSTITTAMRNQSDGILDTIHDLRSLYQADLVSIIVFPSNRTSCGNAKIWTNSATFNAANTYNQIAFSAIDALCMKDRKTLAHELGHNLGMRHALNNYGSGSTCTSPSVMCDYFYGAYEPNNSWITTMTRADYFCQSTCSGCLNSQRLPYFSSPNINIDWNGNTVTIGNATSDNVRGIILTKDTIAKFSDFLSLPSSTHPDCAALEALYNSTDGDNWTDNTGWLTNCDPCGIENGNNPWTGIGCDHSTNRVKYLSLFKNNLNGTIPSEISELDSLYSLALIANDSLIGPIPNSIIELKKLESLSLYTNSLTGPLPPGISTLSNLKILAVQQNNLSGSIPTDLNGLTKLEALNIGVNKFTGTIPIDISQISTLVSLDLHVNLLTGGIPSELSILPNLTRLSLGGNNLEGQIPPELGSMGTLETLGLGSCGLIGLIPPELGNLKNIKYMNLEFNELNGSIPSTFDSLIYMEYLRLNVNNLTGSLPEWLGNLPKLNNLLLYSNSFSGCYPSSLYNLCGIARLELNNNPGLPDNGDVHLNFCQTGQSVCCESDITMSMDTIYGGQLAGTYNSLNTISATGVVSTPNLTFNAIIGIELFPNFQIPSGNGDFTIELIESCDP